MSLLEYIVIGLSVICAMSGIIFLIHYEIKNKPIKYKYIYFWLWFNISIGLLLLIASIRGLEMQYERMPYLYILHYLTSYIPGRVGMITYHVIYSIIACVLVFINYKKNFSTLLKNFNKPTANRG